MGQCLSFLLMVGCAVVTLAVSPGRARADAALSWAAPVAIDSPHGVNAVSCPSVSLCVAVDDAGNVLSSTNPAGGATAWTAANVDGTNPLNGVSCSSSPTLVCVAVDNVGNVVTSSNPTGGAAAWTSAAADPSNNLIAVSCASSSLCVAVGASGHVASTTNPTGGAAAWTTAHLLSSNALLGVSCPSTSLCVADDNSGNVQTATNPTGPAGAWTLAHVDGSHGMFRLSCPTSSLCVAGDSAGNVVTSTNPTGGSAAWTTAGVDGSTAFLLSVSCASESFCVAVDGEGNVVASMNPTGGTSAWTALAVDAAGGLEGVSCPSVSLCVAVDGSGYAVIGAAVVPTHTVTVAKSGPGAGLVTSFPAGLDCGTSCSYAFDAGTQVTLTASPASGSTFAGWSGGGCSGASTCIMTLNADATVTATFTRIPPTQYSLTVSKSGSGSGAIRSIPAAIDCGTSCSYTYDAGTSVTLHATPASGSTFAGWSGSGCSGTSDCTLTLNANSVVTATFALTPPRISAASLTNKRFRVGKTPTAIAAKAPLGTTFRFMLSAAANLQILFTRPAPGVIQHGRCVTPTAALKRKHAKRCTRTLTIAKLTRSKEPGGADAVPFSGRIGKHALTPGNYGAILTATNGAGKSNALTLKFTVLR
jgi:hypothetical protein